MNFLKVNKKELPLEATMGEIPEPPKMYKSAEQYNQEQKQEQQPKELDIIMEGLQQIYNVERENNSAIQELKTISTQNRELIIRLINTEMQLKELYRLPRFEEKKPVSVGRPPLKKKQPPLSDDELEELEDPNGY